MTLPRSEVVDALTEADVPVAPVLTMAEVSSTSTSPAEAHSSRSTTRSVARCAQPNDPTGFA